VKGNSYFLKKYTKTKKGCVYMSTSKKIQWAVSLLLPIILLLTPMALNLKLFFAVTVWGIFTIAFDLVDKLVPSLLMPTLYVLLGIAPSGAVYAAWSSTTVSLAISSLIMAVCLGECGVLERMAYWLLKTCGGKFTRVCWGIFFVSLVLSIFTFGNIAFVIAAMVAGIINVLDIKKTKEGLVLMMGTMWVCMATLYFVYNPTSVPIVAAAAEPVLGKIIPITWMDFAYANWPVILFSILFEFLLIKVFKVDKSDLNLSADFFSDKLKALGDMTKKEKWALVLLAGLFLYIIASPWHHLDTSYGFILFAILALLPGINVATPETLKKVDWGMGFFIAAFLTIGAVATVLGINEYFVNFAGKLLDGTGASITLFFIAAAGAIANLLLTPIAILTTLGAPMAQLAVIAGFSPLASFFTLIFTEWLIVLPYESFPTLLWFSFGCVTTQQFFKVGILRMVCYLAFFLVVILPWWGFIGLI